MHRKLPTLKWLGIHYREQELYDKVAYQAYFLQLPPDRQDAYIHTHEWCQEDSEHYFEHIQYDLLRWLPMITTNITWKLRWRRVWTFLGNVITLTSFSREEDSFCDILELEYNELRVAIIVKEQERHQRVRCSHHSRYVQRKVCDESHAIRCDRFSFLFVFWVSVHDVHITSIKTIRTFSENCIWVYSTQVRHVLRKNKRE